MKLVKVLYDFDIRYTAENRELGTKRSNIWSIRNAGIYYSGRMFDVPSRPPMSKLYDVGQTNSFTIKNNSFYEYKFVAGEHVESWIDLDVDPILMPYLDVKHHSIIYEIEKITRDDSKKVLGLTRGNILRITFDGPDDLGLIWKLSI